jgi:acyl-CoA synthetase (AMP-forming)/AMP-acid ligase II
MVSILSGTNSSLISQVGRKHYRKNEPVLLCPPGLEDPSHARFFEHTNAVLGMYTSGSTGSPKLCLFTREQIEITLDYYHRIYGITSRTLIVSTLPATYNFPYIAVSLLAERAGCEAIYIDFASGEEVTNLLNIVHLHDHVVIIANPIVIQNLAEHVYGQKRLSNVLIDSGGAPLSTHAIDLFREGVADLREGYGLTETCSLTHFDLEGNGTSLGSVGYPAPYAEHDIRYNGHAPEVWLKSTNAGLVVDTVNSEFKDCHNVWLNTGDLGGVDDSGRLFLYGRSLDRLFEGLWPREILNLLGPQLGWRAANVFVSNEHLLTIKTLEPLPPFQRKEIVELVSQKIGREVTDQIRFASESTVTHSKKLTRIC